jgi:hypothetical protein
MNPDEDRRDRIGGSPDIRHSDTLAHRLGRVRQGVLEHVTDVLVSECTEGDPAGLAGGSPRRVLRSSRS